MYMMIPQLRLMLLALTLLSIAMCGENISIQSVLFGNVLSFVLCVLTQVASVAYLTYLWYTQFVVCNIYHTQ